MKKYSIEDALKLDEKLEILAKEKGVTKQELIRHALSLYALPQYNDLCRDCDPIKFPLCDKCLGC
jgi:predicted DNA-binding protein